MGWSSAWWQDAGSLVRVGVPFRTLEFAVGCPWPWEAEPFTLHVGEPPFLASLLALVENATCYCRWVHVSDGLGRIVNLMDLTHLGSQCRNNTSAFLILFKQFRFHNTSTSIRVGCAWGLPLDRTHMGFTVWYVP